MSNLTTCIHEKIASEPMISIWAEPYKRNYMVPSRFTAAYMLYVIFWVCCTISPVLIVSNKPIDSKVVPEFIQPRTEYTGHYFVGIGQTEWSSLTPVGKESNLEVVSTPMDLNYDKVIDKISFQIQGAALGKLHEVTFCFELVTDVGGTLSYAVASGRVGSVAGGNRVSGFYDLAFDPRSISVSHPNPPLHAALLKAGPKGMVKLASVSSDIFLLETFPAIWESVAGSGRFSATLIVSIPSWQFFRPLSVTEQIQTNLGYFLAVVVVNYLVLKFIFTSLIRLRLVTTWAVESSRRSN